MLTTVQQSTAQLQMYINITSHVAPSHFVESFEFLKESHREKKKIISFVILLHFLISAKEEERNYVPVFSEEIHSPLFSSEKILR